MSEGGSQPWYVGILRGRKETKEEGLSGRKELDGTLISFPDHPCMQYSYLRLINGVNDECM